MVASADEARDDADPETDILGAAAAVAEDAARAAAYKLGGMHEAEAQRRLASGSHPLVVIEAVASRAVLLDSKGQEPSGLLDAYTVQHDLRADGDGIG